MAPRPNPHRVPVRAYCPPPSAVPPATNSSRDCGGRLAEAGTTTRGRAAARRRRRELVSHEAEPAGAARRGRAQAFAALVAALARVIRPEERRGVDHGRLRAARRVDVQSERDREPLPTPLVARGRARAGGRPRASSPRSARASARWCAQTSTLRASVPSLNLFLIWHPASPWRKGPACHRSAAAPREALPATRPPRS